MELPPTGIICPYCGTPRTSGCAVVGTLLVMVFLGFMYFDVGGCQAKRKQEEAAVKATAEAADAEVKKAVRSLEDELRGRRQEDVIKRLGQPTSRQDTDSSTIWAYRNRKPIVWIWFSKPGNRVEFITDIDNGFAPP